jgi:hypothetical protein
MRVLPLGLQEIDSSGNLANLMTFTVIDEEQPFP